MPAGVRVELKRLAERWSQLPIDRALRHVDAVHAYALDLAVADARGLAVVSDDGALQEAVDAAIAANPGVAEKIRGGKVQAAGALIGQVMKATKGSADAAKVRELILATLGVEG